ncbi:ArdC family protein [Fusobacterium gastrosuis]|uniref:ArdC family protein n=1 Tax=Fusobacterium gastrosuis TaxID=1755100 RepID=UPI00297A9EC5|nr:zincin-like metallopeptidase domain-containing protein [Fusobacteriaceae bacterium]MDY5714285.1 zincin-like metallopeptidase domain-containing protein [Fusobacterium gastrosuis]
MEKKLAKWEIERENFVKDVIKSLEEGNAPWRKEWKYKFVPNNPTTNTVYKGGNAIKLFIISNLKGYEDDRFLTYLQAESKGWNVKKGAKGIPIEKFLLYDKQTKKTFNPDNIKNLSLKEQMEYKNKNVFPMIKVFYVFNGADIEGIPPLKKEIKEVNYNKIDKILDNSGVKVLYGGGQAFYSPGLDEIHLPEKRNFISEQTFYSTALHELAHSTGHKDRFNRDLNGKFGSDSYSKEELIAELSSVFSGMKLPLNFDNSVLDNSKAYLQSWAKALENNKNLIYESSKEAEKVSDFIVKLQNQHNNEIFKNNLSEVNINASKIIENKNSNSLIEKIQAKRENKENNLGRGV